MTGKRLIVGALVLVAGVTGTVSAQIPGSERIPNFDSQAVIDREGTAAITETIVYDFGVTPKHGIFRNVPVRYQDPEGKKYYAEFVEKAVTQDGQPAKMSREDNSSQAILKIGDADKTITGRHTYVIAYELKPVARQGEGRDFMALDVTGDEWKVPIEQARGTVTYRGPTPTASRCFAGTAGTTEQFCAATPGGASVTVAATRPLSPGQGLTVESDFAPGSFTKYLEPRAIPPLHLGRYAGFITGVGLLLLSLLWLVGSAIRQRFLRSRETIVPQYETPDKLTPAEIGYLTDNKGDLTEVTATLIDLAVRGYLKIEQTAPGKLFSKARYKLTKRKAPGALTTWERTIYDAVFLGGNNAVSVSDLDRTKMAAAVSSFQSQLKQRLEKNGYYAKSRTTHRLNRLGIILTALVFLGTAVWHLLTPGGIEWLGALGATFGGLVVFWLVVNRSRPTKAGVAEWAEVAGFKRFLSMTEKDRLAFTDAPKRNPKQFSAFLPYAVALGVEKEWAKQFEGMDIDKQAGWYSGTRPITPVYLASDMSSSFAGVVSSNFSPVSSSSGGSGGGGSVGGGSGGGGGGSW